MPERRLSQPGQLVDHGVGRIAVKGSKQRVYVKGVGNDWRDAEFDQPIATVLAAGEA